MPALKFLAFFALYAFSSYTFYLVGKQDVTLGSCPAAHWTPPSRHQPKETVA